MKAWRGGLLRLTASQQEVALEEIMYAAWKFDDKPHLLFSAVKAAAKGHPDEAEISRLMDEAYNNIHRWQR